MYGITNRQIRPRQSGSGKLGPKPSPQGPNELRLFRATRAGRGWHIELIADRLTREMKQQVNAPVNQPAWGSYYVAKMILQQARQEKRNVLFFVHGYNNDIDDVLRRADELEKRYQVIAVPFSWPANGGGAVSGTLSYKSDKRDARASAGALDRTLLKLADYLLRFTQEMRNMLWQQARGKYPENLEARDKLYSALLDKECPFCVNALFHSMGNYLFKQVLKSSASEGNQLLFDNIVLAAADTNNLEHAAWVDRIKFRRRLYVTINENDRALAASRAKAGQEQQARLGHSLFNLTSAKATYIDLSEAAWVSNSHAYFEGQAADKNEDIRQFFNDAFNGQVAERGLRYIPDRNVYQFK